MQLTAKTAIVGLIGDPVSHSLSPTIHNAAYQALGIDFVYVAFPVAESGLKAAVAGALALGVAGLSVTTPYKERVVALCESASDEVVALGAANTLVADSTGFAAQTTDGLGLVNSLRDSGFEPRSKRCMVLGAGGAGRAVAHALGRAGAGEIVIVNRSQERAATAAFLGGENARVGTVREAPEMDLIVNATTIGMGSETFQFGDLGQSPITEDLLTPNMVVTDLVYHPLTTPLLSLALRKGAQVVDGLQMLIFQAALQITLWTGKEAPIEAMRAIAKSEIQLRSSSR